MKNREENERKKNAMPMELAEEDTARVTGGALSAEELIRQAEEELREVSEQAVRELKEDMRRRKEIEQPEP